MQHRASGIDDALATSCAAHYGIGGALASESLYTFTALAQYAVRLISVRQIHP
ncbi:MAG: hypothetical protein JWL61_4182 [Gemmatimonadetes bacterium]|nr:hypothetical protein [Gemmatimonadota bacterium]